MPKSVRCLVPIGSFFEWRAIKGLKPKQPNAISMKNGEPLALAGIWENWQPRGVRNVLKLMNGRAIDGGYDGYASCPLTTAKGKAIIAEFIYGGEADSDPASPRPGQRTVAWLVDQGQRPADHVLALHAQRLRVVPQT